MKNNLEVPVKKNEIYLLDIIDFSSEGFGIGKIDGFTIFVENSYTGDRVNVVIVKVLKNYAYGKSIETINPSSHRREPTCPVANVCGGCSLQHIDYNSQLDYKTKVVSDSLTRLGKFQNIEVLRTISSEEEYRYRNKAQFPVSFYNGCYAGFYAKRSHNVIKTENCLLQKPSSNKIVNIIIDFINEYNISPYDEKKHSGLVRHIITKIGFETDDTAVILVINGDKLPHSDKLSYKLKQIPQIKTFVINKNTKQTNVIIGNNSDIIFGNGYIDDYIDGLKFQISYMSFYQVNPYITRLLYKRILDLAEIKQSDIIIDAYCGIGTISLYLARYAKKIIGIEVVEQAIEDAKQNAIINKIENCEFHTGKSEYILPKLYEAGILPNTVVIDPPRSGCDIKVIQSIIDMSPEKIIYVSCNPATLARDLNILSEEQKKYQIIMVQPYDMFCQTLEVETVVLLKKI